MSSSLTERPNRRRVRYRLCRRPASTTRADPVPTGKRFRGKSMFTFYDAATRQDIPCTFHEIRGGANARVGVAEFIAHNAACYVPVLILGDTRDKQFAEADWRK